MRWRDVGLVHRWDDVIAVLECEPFDSPIAKAQDAKEWFWYDPTFVLLNDLRNHLQGINYKTPLPSEEARKGFPDPVLPPWLAQKGVETVAPPPSTQADIDAHLARLNGRN